MSSIASLTLLAAFASGPSGTTTMNESVLNMSVQCKTQDRCWFDDKDVELRITIQNPSSVAVQIPLQYLRLRGAFVAILDPKTGRPNEMHVSRPDPQLREVLTTLFPGQSFSVGASVDAGKLRSFFVDKPPIIVAVISMPTDVHLPDGGVVAFDSTKTIEIFRGRADAKFEQPPTAKTEISAEQAKELIDKFNGEDH